MHPSASDPPQRSRARQRTGRRRPPLPSAASALVAAAAVVAGPLLAGCASGGGAQDGGAASRLSPPVSASPLWPDRTPPAPPTEPEPRAGFKRYPPVEGVTVPSGGLKDVPVKELLEKDANVPKLAQVALEDCPGSHCPLRSPVYRELTGDGQDELVVAVDEPASRLTVLQVYRASGGKIRPVLIYWGQLGLTGETFGRDLVVTATGDDGSLTTRFRWNGEVLAPVTARDGSDAPAAPGKESGGRYQRPFPDETAPVPRTDDRTDPRTTP